MPQTIRAEMVASVLSIEVAIGDEVSTDHVIVVLESMKMEIPVVPEEPGTVAEISVAVGDVVREGDVLVILS